MMPISSRKAAWSAASMVAGVMPRAAQQLMSSIRSAAAGLRLADRRPSPDDSWDGDDPDPSFSRAPYRLYNIGNNTPVPLTRVIELLEQNLGVTAEKILLPMQPGDVPATYADVEALAHAVDFRPSTPIETGLARFVDWYRDFYGARPAP